MDILNITLPSPLMEFSSFKSLKSCGNQELEPQCEYERLLLLNAQLTTPEITAGITGRTTSEKFSKAFSSIHQRLAEMELKLSNVFMSETEYLQTLEDRLAEEELRLCQKISALDKIRKEKDMLKEKFDVITQRLKYALNTMDNTKNISDQYLAGLYEKNMLLDAQVHDLMSGTFDTLMRIRHQVSDDVREFHQTTAETKHQLHSKQVLVENTEKSVDLILELVRQLAEVNDAHKTTLSTCVQSMDDKLEQFEQTLDETSEWNIEQEMAEIKLLERQKQVLNEELKDKAILLEKIQQILQNSAKQE
ncbi:unnamed protein product [Didymodactylos carnosus]|uniref:Uncharacterized protein n=1 Tax=Didymodactylos carnosus TaxID=1234261 RepID=A0A814RKK4_9BILA|nr:unnamed protein product [Didymodactylos carnosus]CAF1134486.1 unnamed protein product [Didymodactylos carnosus]CAF3688308.1 unnamed protein product [Didymodactylos carnosus]CAF3898254.1 unnamed protein product [Didymodactylos carnosus]